MKKFRLLAILTTLFVLTSCKNELVQKNDSPQTCNVSFEIELPGIKTTGGNARTIAIPDLSEQLNGYSYTAKFTNKNNTIITETGNFDHIVSYLRMLSLAKGEWTLTVTGTKTGSTTVISGSTTFSAGTMPAQFILVLSIAGEEGGSIQMDYIDYRDPIEFYITLTPIDDYINNVSNSNILYYKHPDVVDPADDTVHAYEIVQSDSGNPDSYTYTVNDVPKGIYNYEISCEDGLLFRDVAYVYPGMISKREAYYGKPSLILNFNYKDEYGDDYIEYLDFNNGITYLPGFYDSDINDRAYLLPEVSRAGYIFTGWYDTPQTTGKEPAIPLTSKYYKMENYLGIEGYYKLADKTLYAGWQKADLKDGVLEQPLLVLDSSDRFDLTSLQDLAHDARGYFDDNNKVQLPNNTYAYLTSGSELYYISSNKLYYCDLVQGSTSTEISLPASSSFFANSLISPTSNIPLAIYKSPDGVLYVLCSVGVNFSSKDCSLLYLAKEANSQTHTLTPVAVEPATATSIITDFLSSNTITFQKMAVSNDKVYLSYMSGEEPCIIVYDIQSASLSTLFSTGVFGKSLSKIQTSETMLSTLYEKTKCGQNGGEPVYAKQMISDMAFYDSSLWVLVHENSFDCTPGNVSSKFESFVSRGAVIQMDSDLNVIGTFGKAEVKDYPIPTQDDPVPVYGISHLYEITSFAEPIDIIAIDERKLWIKEQGLVLYKRPDGKSKMKKKFIRITEFDLDTKCIDYTQIAEIDRYGSNVVRDEFPGSAFEWENVQ